MKPIDIFIKFLRKSVKKDGFIINYDGDKYIVGQPLSQKPIEVCLNKKNLPLKLILCPDLYFGEAYVNSDIVIKNGNISDNELKIDLKSYYFSNVIAKSSKTMNECNNSKLEKKLTGTDG